MIRLLAMVAVSSEMPSAPADWSAVPNDSEEDRLLMNRRVGYLGGTIFVISGTFWVFNVIAGVLLATSPRPPMVLPRMWLHLAASVLFGLVWLACRRGRRTSTELNLLDVGGLVLGMALFGAMISLPPTGFVPGLILSLITVTVVVTHAVIVPGTVRRTALVSAAACLPAPIATFVAMGQSAGPELLSGRAWHASTATAYVGMWSTSTVIVCAFIARVIYGLRERVRQATELGQYRLEERIGAGGMGVVYRARHMLLRRPTAVKLLPPERTSEADVLRFEREVQLTSSLTHPNTVAIYDFGRTPDGVFYYVMEYLDGLTLEELVKHDGPLPPARVVHVLKQVAGALGEAHALGLIHRDIKPANIMLCVRGRIPDHVKILDFGLVKEVHAAEDAALSVAGALLGTPLYLAPEAIVDSTRVDARIDIYSLGAVAYQLLTGRPPFEGAGLVEICAKHLHEAPAPLSERAPGTIPASLERLVLDCLAKDPSKRPASAEALLAALASLDGVGTWDDAQAARWWSDVAPALQRRSRQADAPARSGERTVLVDLHGRA